MRPFVLLLALVLIAYVAATDVPYFPGYGDHDDVDGERWEPCTEQAQVVKDATRTANAWKAVCEDAKWKGAGCYNYWAQVDELMSKEVKLQACLERSQTNLRAFTLGSTSPSKAGIFRDDATNSQGTFASHTITTLALLAKESDSTQAFLVSQFQAMLDSLKNKVDTQSSSTRALFDSETTNILATLQVAVAVLTDRVNVTTNNELALEKATAAQDRSYIVANHTYTKNTVITKARDDGSNTRNLITALETDARTYETAKSTDLKAKISLEALKIRNIDTTEEATTNTLASSEYNATRTTSSSSSAGERDDVATKLGAGNQDDVLQAEADNRASIHTAQASTQSTASSVFNDVTALFSGLQVMLQQLYGQENAQLNQMSAMVMNITAHLDLRPHPNTDKDGFGNTHSHQAPEHLGGRILALRAACLDTINANKLLYGANRIGDAVSYFNDGEIFLSRGMYRSAAYKYRAAYAEAISPYQ